MLLLAHRVESLCDTIFSTPVNLRSLLRNRIRICLRGDDDTSKNCEQGTVSKHGFIVFVWLPTKSVTWSRHPGCVTVHVDPHDLTRSVLREEEL
jgi:hypothetical protein